MGFFMIPCCCICGKSAKIWNDANWRWQDFCPEHGKIIEEKYGELTQYCVYTKDGNIRISQKEKDGRKEDLARI